jgi:hypothetical protein
VELLANPEYLSYSTPHAPTCKFLPLVMKQLPANKLTHMPHVNRATTSSFSDVPRRYQTPSTRPMARVPSIWPTTPGSYRRRQHPSVATPPCSLPTVGWSSRSRTPTRAPGCSTATSPGTCRRVSACSSSSEGPTLFRPWM